MTIPQCVLLGYVSSGLTPFDLCQQPQTIPIWGFSMSSTWPPSNGQVLYTEYPCIQNVIPTPISYEVQSNVYYSDGTNVWFYSGGVSTILNVPCPTPTAFNCPTPTPTITLTATIPPGLTPTPTPTITLTATLPPTPTPTESPTQTPTQTQTNTPAQTLTPTPTQTQTNTPSPTLTPTPTQTPTLTPSSTLTPTPTKTSTLTPTPTKTLTPTPTSTPLTCVVESYCISTGEELYDGNYYLGGTWNNELYWIGSTNNFFIYYSSGTTQWCLSDELDGNCLLFGASSCSSICPDLCGGFFNEGPCPTPTPTPTEFCQQISFDAIFDCELPLTPTPTLTGVPQETPTPTPTATEICGGLGISLVVNILTPTPKPTTTNTPTLTSTPQYNCNFDGSVVFNTFDDYIKCSGSKIFKDCNTGFLYYTTDVVLDPLGNTPDEGYVYQSFVDGISTCVVYNGFVNDIAGVSTIVLTGILGLESQGSCSQCVIINTPTPTPTLTSTPTPTPSTPTSTCYNYLITNSFIMTENFMYNPCSTGTPTQQNIEGNSSLTICSSSVPTTDSTFITITNIGLCG